MKGKVIVLILLLLVVEFAVIYAMYYYFNNVSCDYNNPSKAYIKHQPCVINFLCTENHTAFSDSCGCGCKLNS